MVAVPMNEPEIKTFPFPSSASDLPLSVEFPPAFCTEANDGVDRTRRWVTREVAEPPELTAPT